MIRIEDLNKKYPSGNRKIVALDRVNLEIKEGEFLILLGKSGSGKSTFLNLLSGIDKPDSGSIWISDQNITILDDNALTIFRRDHIGFIYQFLNLLPTLTVLENVCLPLFLNGRNPPGSKEQGLMLLSKVGLKDRAHDYPDRLSGGEQQRVAIARALAKDPELILADEPTGNLDSETGQNIILQLFALSRDLKKTVVLVTHSRDALQFADRVFQLKDGRLFNLQNDKK